MAGREHHLPHGVDCVEFLPVDLEKSEVFFNRVFECQGRDLCLILDQLHGLVCCVQIVMVCVAVRLMHAVGAGLEIFHHCLAVFVCGDRRQVCVIIVNVKGETLERHLGLLVDLDNTDRELFGVRHIDLPDQLRRIGSGINVDLMHDFIFEITLRWLDLNDLIKALFKICHTGIAVDVGFDCLKDLTIPADLEGRA